ncbi:MAG TPA: aldo/keto reductase [Patescibacteria group bacterium]|jgi:diketogulonate reductase-like aldo/keto reductase|nr:aldo/keto reductase [Patescibacteria group bacterium]
MEQTVPTVTLNDGNTMPQFGLGVWKAANGGETERAVTEAINAGYRLIDTAALYMNEEDVGRAIAKSDVPREELFITTKLWNSDQGAENVRAAFEKSLHKLGLDYVDLYLIHWPTPERDLYVETWKEFEKLKQEGLVHSIGVSNFQPAHLERLAAESSTVPVVNQIELHPGFNQDELRAYGKAHDIYIESWSPIGGSQGNVLEDERVINIASNHGKTPAQVVIRWHIHHGLIVIPKSVNPARIRENIDVFDFALTEEEMATLDALSGKRQGPDPDTMNSH